MADAEREKNRRAARRRSINLPNYRGVVTRVALLAKKEKTFVFDPNEFDGSEYSSDLPTSSSIGLTPRNEVGWGDVAELSLATELWIPQTWESARACPILCAVVPRSDDCSHIQETIPLCSPCISKTRTIAVYVKQRS